MGKILYIFYLLFCCLFYACQNNQQIPEMPFGVISDSLAQPPTALQKAKNYNLHQPDFDKIEDYQPFMGIVGDAGDSNAYLLLRRFSVVMDSGKQIFYLAVNPYSLQTQVLLVAPQAVLATSSWYDAELRFADAAYIVMRQAAKDNRKIKHNAGIRNLPNTEGVIISIDLCPSKHSLDKDLFHFLIDSVAKNKAEIPVSICVSGQWIRHHKADFAWLLEQKKAEKININWVNHSFYHRCDTFCPRDSNFLLLPGTNVAEEILKTELVLLNNKQLPSCFFRFPGLASDEMLFNTVLNDYGLIPLGSDAWLANKVVPKAGSIMLLHGNGNEPAGISFFIKQYQAGKIALPFYDIRSWRKKDGI